MVNCILCHSDDIRPVPHNISGGVTSDCSPYPHAANFFVCKNCGGLQKYQHKRWLNKVGNIYAKYHAHDMSDGREQPVYGNEGEPLSRSSFVMKSLFNELDLPAYGDMLDIGCGSGPMLRAYGECFPHMRLWGQDEHVMNIEKLSSLPGVEGIITQSLDCIDKTYDVITLAHVLEHVFDPITFLGQIKQILAKNGRLIIQVPDVARNPFDLMVYDHATHFTSCSLYKLLKKSGFCIEIIKNYLPREITLVANLSNNEDFPAPRDEAPPLPHFDFLLRLNRSFKSKQNMSVFGTAIAANWLSSIDGERISNYLDENPLLIGQKINGKEINHPESANRDRPVIIPFAPPTKDKIRNKLKQLGYHNFI